MEAHEPNFIAEAALERHRRSKAWRRFFAVFWISAVSFVSYFVFLPASNFPENSLFIVEEGDALGTIAGKLERSGFVKKALALRLYIKIVKNDDPVIAGPYLFSKPENISEIAERLVAGEHRIAKASILIPEGFDAADIAGTFREAMPSFDSVKFLSISSKDEGYLFPDTYDFFTNITPEEAHNTLRSNFDAKTGTLLPKIEHSGRTLSDAVIMGSILEREAATPKDRRIISGILWKRIKIGMPLQVDAAFDAVNGKTTHALSASDLKIDSPYNTYKYKGLPPGPICNPGLDSILAAVEPETTPYLYYLSDPQGKMYYAKNFEEHKLNKIKYLR